MRVALLAAVATMTSAVAQDPVPAGAPDAGQLHAPLTWIEDTARPGVRYRAQRTRDGRLLLTADESFFATRGLEAVGTGLLGLPDEAVVLNKGRSFAEIRGWSEGARAEWPLWFDAAGTFMAYVRMRCDVAGKRFSLEFAGQREDLVTRAVDGVMWKVRLRVDTPGRHTLALTCRDAVASKDTAVRWIELMGDAATSGAVLRARWRPAAAHARLSSSAAPEDIRLWVVEVDGAPSTMSCYAPVTTPFGYFGSSWEPEGHVRENINFSMWSYGRGKAEPPVEELSHLLAIGDRDARFDGFGHEGTGVKVRGWAPYAGKTDQRQVLALRVERGDPYDTYTGYFWDFGEQRWRLYASGNPRPKGGRRNRPMFVGTFVEVPGPPHRQRTGHVVRRVRYRGWVFDAQRRCYPLDRMTGEGKPGEWANRERGVEDGRFWLQMGGMAHVGPNAAVRLDDPAPRTAVPYLGETAMRPLFTLPATITVLGSEARQGKLKVRFRVAGAGQGAAVTAFWGEKEALTFASRWSHRRALDVVDGDNEVVLPAAATHVRLLLQCQHGQFWTAVTHRVTRR